MSKFFAPNYALMRHAKDSRDGKTTILTPAGAKACVENVRQFAWQIPGKNVRIFHSPQTRAQLTAELVASVLRESDIHVDGPDSLDWLNCDNPAVNDENIRAVILGDEETFFLFITHLPQVGDYLDIDWEGSGWPPNSTIISQNFQLPGG